MKLLFILLLALMQSLACNAQIKITKSIKDFGAKGNGHSDDQDAFAKASAFFNNRKGHGKLVIPKGVYIVGRQKFAGSDIGSKNIAYVGDNVLDLKDCHDMIIEGKPGATLKHRDSLRIGTFSPVTGEPFKHSIKEIYLKTEYARYASNAGNMISVSNCGNINITGLKLNGNTANFMFGGNWGIGRNAYELIHYGINILDSHDVDIKNCGIENFACDGIYIANLGQEMKTYNITIDKCKVNYSGRNGLSWLGGENIRVSNAEFSNSGQGVVHESPAAGIDIEVENNSFCRNGYFYNCTMENNIGSAIASGSKALSSNVLFKKCIAASPVYYTVFADAASHRFEDCKLYGTVLVWYRGMIEKDAVKFRRCLFEENYKGKKMYDGTYQLGIEATGVQVDSCIFRAYTTSSYYLAGHAKNCESGNPEMLRVSNSSFYNYCKTGIKLNGKVAGNAGHTVFYNNRFYARPGVSYQNGFSGDCHADGGKNKFYITAQ
ncbi:MAG: right-handed parallel beta-helix repeat-containing protein [Ferruginibacter sp.]